MKLKIISATLLAVAAVGAAQAQDVMASATSVVDWHGFFIGANIGGAWNHTCESWEPSQRIKGNPTLANAFYNRDCPNNGTFIGGIQGGYLFQNDKWVWGLGVDYEIWSSKNRSRSATYTGNPTNDPALPPNGTYTFSGKTNPNGLFLVGPRVGYAIDQWLPYVRVGGVFTTGSHTMQATYTDTAGETAVFGGGKNTKSSGYNAGFGVQYALGDRMSIGAEYNYINLGKGTNSVTSCSASGTACGKFNNINLDNIHNSFTANLFRVQFNYGF